GRGLREIHDAWGYDLSRPPQTVARSRAPALSPSDDGAEHPRRRGSGHPARSPPAFGPLLDLHLLVTVGGRVRTVAEHQQLFEAAGFRLTQLIPTQSVFGESVLEGVLA